VYAGLGEDGIRVQTVNSPEESGDIAETFKVGPERAEGVVRIYRDLKLDGPGSTIFDHTLSTKAFTDFILVGASSVWAE